MVVAEICLGHQSIKLLIFLVQIAFWFASRYGSGKEKTRVSWLLNLFGS